MTARAFMALAAGVMCASGCGRLGFGERAAGVVPNDGGGDGSAFAMDPRGFWIATATRTVGDPADRDRDDLVGGIRCDLTITDGSPLVVQYRYAELTDSLATMQGSGTGSVTTDAGDWVLSDGDGDTGAYLTTWTDADHVSLALAPDDPRNLGLPTLERIDLERDTPPNPALVKSWTLGGFELPGDPLVIAGVCTGLPAGDSVIAVGTVVMSPLFLLAITETVQAFAMVSCAGSSMTSNNMLNAYFEERDGAYRSWASYTVNGGASQSFASVGTVAADGTGFDVVQTSCLPAAACVDAVTIAELR